jgi:recombination protein RecR
VAQALEWSPAGAAQVPADDRALQRLLDELGRLPGIGPKSAQRIAYYLLEADDETARRLANAILQVKE